MLDSNSCLPASGSIKEDAQHIASEDLNLGVDTEIGGSPYRLQNSESLVGFTGPGVDILVTVAGCCHLDAQIGEFFNVF